MYCKILLNCYGLFVVGSLLNILEYRLVIVVMDCLLLECC